jgi:hypothetical protein
VTTVQPPEKSRTRIAGRSTSSSDTSELMRHLLTDLPDGDQRHLIDVVDRNHAEQLARKRRARHEPESDVVELENDQGDDY